MQHLAAERSPLRRRHPNLAAARIIHRVRNPTQRRVVTQGQRGRNLWPAESVKPRWLDFADHRRRGPGPLLRGHGNDATIRTDPESIWITKATGQFLARPPVNRNAMNTYRIHVIEIAFRIDLQTGDIVV